MTATDTPVYRRIIISFANAFKERGCLDPNCIILSITMCRHGMMPGIDATGDSPLVAYFAARSINRQVMIASKLGCNAASMKIDMGDKPAFFSVAMSSTSFVEHWTPRYQKIVAQGHRSHFPCNSGR